MLPVKHRLPTPLIKGVIFRGRAVSGPCLRLKWQWSRSPVSRAVIVVSTQVDKRAVVRNRLKRQLREIVRLVLPQLRPSADIVIFTNKNAAVKSFQELKDELIQLLQKARLIPVNFQ